MFIKLKEPQWWMYILETLNDFADKNYIVSKYVPVTADIFVFTYPFYLVALYLYWVFNKNIDYKYASLYIFFSWFASVLASQAFQFLVIKDRPEDHISSKKNLILEHLPDISFPSDHATLSITIATSTLLWWIKSNNKFFLHFSLVLYIFAFTMWVSRVMGWVHRPTDIIAGLFLWVFVSIFMIQPKIFSFFKKYLYDPLIAFQNFLFEKIFKIKP